MPTYLDFEEPIQELEEQLEKAKEIGEQSQVDITKTERELKKKIKDH